MNYQEERNERLSGDSNYLKQINSNAMYSDIPGPKTNTVYIVNKEGR